MSLCDECDSGGVVWEYGASTSLRPQSHLKVVWNCSKRDIYSRCVSSYYNLSWDTTEVAFQTISIDRFCYHHSKRHWIVKGPVAHRCRWIPCSGGRHGRKCWCRWETIWTLTNWSMQPFWTIFVYRGHHFCQYNVVLWVSKGSLWCQVRLLSLASYSVVLGLGIVD